MVLQAADINGNRVKNANEEEDTGVGVYGLNDEGDDAKA